MASLSKNIFSVEKGHLNLVIMTVALCAILLPIVFGRSFAMFEGSPVNDAIISPDTHLSHGILMASTIPLLIDTALDYGIIYDKICWKQYLFGRVPIAITGFLVSVQFFVISSTPSIFGLTDSRAGSYLFNLDCFKIVLMSCNMFILTLTNPGVFAGWISTSFTSLVCTITVVRAYMPGSSPAYHQFSVIFSSIGFIPIILSLIYCCYKWISTTNRASIADYTCLLYVLYMLYVNLVRVLI